MKHLAIITAAVAASAGFASAQSTIVQTKSFSGVPDFSEPLLFNKYNGLASNLLNVNISYSLTIVGGQFVMDNDANSPASVTANFGATLDATSTDVQLRDNTFNLIVDDVAALNTGTFNLAPNQGDGLNDYDPTGPDGAILVGTTQTKTGNGDVAAMFLGGYVGTNQFTVNAIAKQVASLTSNSGVETATTPVSARGFVTVTYTVVPEPSSSALAGLAALGLAFRRRRA
ncbi:choice-of-anchor E domain-containing protein [Akkermansiaceae bacterium]|nr:choice-of-anchor E domain-containing protein [Akkermansiaceae bacterium]